MSQLTEKELLTEVNKLTLSSRHRINFENSGPSKQHDLLGENIVTYMGGNNNFQTSCAEDYFGESYDDLEHIYISNHHLTVPFSVCEYFIDQLNKSCDYTFKISQAANNRVLLEIPAFKYFIEQVAFTHILRVLYNPYGKRYFPVFLFLSKRVNCLTPLQNILYSFLLSNCVYKGSDFLPVLIQSDYKPRHLQTRYVYCKNLR